MAEGKPRVSVLMPVYNEEKYLKEAIDSVLEQTFSDFELIIVNDGSTDSSENIIKSYSDDRIKYFKKKNGGVANALNYGLDKCQGEYVARFDGDDVMFKDRLEYQVLVMDNNPKVDIAGFGMQWGNGKKVPEYFTPQTKELKFTDFLRGNPMSHPTVIFRKSSVDKLPFVYEPYYSCEDFKLWLTALSKGLRIATFSKPVILYRQHKDQIVSSNVKEIFRDTDRARRSFDFEEGNELTCVIAGRNEGTEVERTMSSIRATADKVSILFIDDASDDGFDYESVCKVYNARYVRNDSPIGSAGSKNKGVYLVDTKYFCLFDCHMRLYDDKWDVRLIRALDENPGCLITSQSLSMSIKDGDYVNENGKDRKSTMLNGAYVNLYEDGWEFTEKWAPRLMDASGTGLTEVPCVLGAVYASSVEHWKRIHGLDGLVVYGHEEPFMSMKTWLSGGRCLLMRNWLVGHLYREKQPFRLPGNSLNANQIINEFFFLGDSTEFDRLQENLKVRIGKLSYEQARSMVDFDFIRREREYFFGNVAKVSFDEFEQKNRKVKV